MSGWRQTSASANLGCMLSGSRPADARKDISYASEAVSEGKFGGEEAWPPQSMGSSVVAGRRKTIQGARPLHQDHQGSSRDPNVFDRFAGKQRNRPPDITGRAVRRLHKGRVLAFMPAQMEGVDQNDN